jgi:hypothetical protein
VKRLPYDVQRDMSFYRLSVEFRNAIERMMIRQGRTLDTDHLWWGFGDTGRRREPPSDGGLAGSRVPRRPHGGVGGDGVELEQPIPADEDLGTVV